MIHDGFGGFSRTQSPVNENFRFTAPVDDIYLFIVQFLDNSLNPDTFESDTSTNGIDTLVIRINSYFGSITGKTGNTLDFNDSIINFRNFYFEKPDKKK